jgi:hypothetical protein
MNTTGTDAVSDLYRPPAAELRDAPRPAAARETPFYVVGRRKFLIMTIGTLGLYTLYWFYAHWAHLNRAQRAGYWPVARAIFAIFFTHSLFGEVEQTLARERRRYDWSPQGLATVYVICSILTSGLGRVPASVGAGAVVVTQLLSFGLFGVMVYVLYRAQGAINLACDDPQGDSNRSLGLANFFWLVPGGLIWLTMLLGLIAILGGRTGA